MNTRYGQIKGIHWTNILSLQKKAKDWKFLIKWTSIKEKRKAKLKHSSYMEQTLEKSNKIESLNFKLGGVEGIKNNGLPFNSLRDWDKQIGNLTFWFVSVNGASIIFIFFKNKKNICNWFLKFFSFGLFHLSGEGEETH